MKHVAAGAAAAWAIAACLLATAAATSNYSYRKNEYRVVQDGYAPNRRYSIAAHGGGELGYDNFRLYLMAEPRHRRVAPLEGIGPDVLDTGADAYRAAWSADSRHVALHYRIDRHQGMVSLFAIRNGRTAPVSGPDPLRAVMKRATSADDEARAGTEALTWLGRTRFVLKDTRLFKTRTTALADALGRFGKSEPREPDQSEPSAWYLVRFSAEAVCDLVSDGKYAIVQLKPGRFDE